MTSRFRDTNRAITIDGDTKLLVEWAEEYGVSVPLILGRIERGWDIERAITQPARKYRTHGGDGESRLSRQPPDHPDGD